MSADQNVFREPIMETYSANHAALTELSNEFQRVVDRISNELSDRSIDSLDPEVLTEVEVAEQTIDVRALELQRGLCAPRAWKAALAEYETRWLNILDELGERRN